MDALAQSALLVSLTSFSFGVSTLARNVRNKLYLSFALAAGTVSLWALFYFIASVWPSNGWYGYHLALNAWVVPSGLFFIQSMMRIEKWQTSRLLFFGSLLFSLLVTILLLFGVEKVGWVRDSILFAPSLLLLQVGLLMIYDRELNPVVGIRHRYLLYGSTILVLLTSSMDHIQWLWVGVPVFGNFALTIYIFFVSQAVTQQRLLDLGSMLSRFLVLVIVALLLAAVFSLVRSWAKDLALFFLNSVFVSFFLLSLLEPIRRSVRYVMDRVFTRRAVAFRNEVEIVLQDLSWVVNPRESLDIFEKFITRVLQPKRLSIYIPSTDPRLFLRERWIGEDQGSWKVPSEIPRQHPIFDALAFYQNRSKVLFVPLLEDEIERMAGRSLKGRLEVWREAILAFGGNLVFPFYREGRLMAFAVIDVDQPPKEYGSNWSILRELEPLGERVGELVEKSALYEREREVERLATIGEMAAGLAHEIRNPLGAIKGAIQYLGASDPTGFAVDKDNRFLRVIQEEADRLNGVVSQFLDYAKPSVAKELKEFDLNILIQRLVHLLAPTAPPEVDLRFQSSLLKARVRGSPEQIHQVLLNLIQNAFKALRRWEIPGGGDKRVLISLDRFETQDLRSKIRITVEDNGPGIPKENFEKIFIPFFTTDPSGSGLGLPICRKIIQSHDGTIEVSSVMGVTTQFRVILPEAP